MTYLVALFFEEKEKAEYTKKRLKELLGFEFTVIETTERIVPYHE
jgi:hypothetical protein